jgi:hypothetical protein
VKLTHVAAKKTVNVTFGDLDAVPALEAITSAQAFRKLETRRAKLREATAARTGTTNRGPLPHELREAASLERATPVPRRRRTRRDQRERRETLAAIRVLAAANAVGDTIAIDTTDDETFPDTEIPLHVNPKTGEVDRKHLANLPRGLHKRKPDGSVERLRKPSQARDPALGKTPNTCSKKLKIVTCDGVLRRPSATQRGAFTKVKGTREVSRLKKMEERRGEHPGSIDYRPMLWTTEKPRRGAGSVESWTQFQTSRDDFVKTYPSECMRQNIRIYTNI